jgi:hypothetical protein
MLAFSVILYPFGLMVTLGILVVLTRLMKHFEKRFREIDVRLTPLHRHVYFGVGMVYYFASAGALLAWATRHSSPPAWFAAGLGLTVLLVSLYAATNITYGRNAKI